ncbi:MAG: aldehyde dehydrogenase family protein, partial [Bacillota bacterium]
MNYNAEQIKKLVDAQRAYFRTGETLDVDWRILQLKRLKTQMKLYEKEITDALAADLGRSETEAYFCDVGTVILEINETIQGLRRWAKPDVRFSGMTCFPSIFTKIYHKPYGTALIISPFNFPFTLTFGVLAASVAGGNTAVIKTSSKTPHCTDVMIKMVSEIFPEEYVTVIGDGHDVADMCLDQRFDKIFYTGSPAVAKHVMA